MLYWQHAFLRINARQFTGRCIRVDPEIIGVVVWSLSEDRKPQKVTQENW